MPDNDPFDHAGFCREIEWYNKSVNYGGGKPEPFTPATSWHGNSSRTSSGSVMTRSRPARKPLSGDPRILIVFVSSFFCLGSLQIALWKPLIDYPAVYLSVVFGLTLIYFRISARVLAKKPSGFIAGFAKLVLFSALSVAPFFLLIIALATAS